jgi:hypothetical protein
VSTQIRLPADVHERVKRIAQQEERSMNAQLVFFVRQALERYLAEHPEKGSRDAGAREGGRQA